MLCFRIQCRNNELVLLTFLRKKSQNVFPMRRITDWLIALQSMDWAWAAKWFINRTFILPHFFILVEYLDGIRQVQGKSIHLTNCNRLDPATEWCMRLAQSCNEYFSFWKPWKRGKNCLQDESVVYNSLYTIYNRSAVLSVETVHW